MRDAKTLRTVSVRLSQEDARALSGLRQALGDAEPYSEIANQLSRGRGRHTAYDAPVADGEAIRWAVRFALDRYPSDLAAAPTPHDGRDRHRRTVDR